MGWFKEMVVQLGFAKRCLEEFEGLKIDDDLVKEVENDDESDDSGGEGGA